MAERTAFEILQDTLKKVKFYNYKFDNAFLLNAKHSQIVVEFYRDFYFIQWKRKHGGLFQAMRFNLLYNRNRDKFPSLIVAEAINIETFSEAAPGNSLDKTNLIGYFKDLKQPSGAYFRNIFDIAIEQILPAVSMVKAELKILITQVEVGSEKQTKIIEFYKDVAMILEFGNFIVKLFLYCRKKKIKHIKSGHLIAFVSGVHNYFSILSSQLIDLGFAAVSVDDSYPIFAYIDETSQKSEILLMDFLFDILNPLAEAMVMEIQNHNGSLKLIEKSIIKRSFITNIVGFFASLFSAKQDSKKQKNKEKPKSKETKQEKIKAKDEKQIITIIPRNVNDLHAGLKKFIEELKSDLAPEIDDKGKTVDYNCMFDQFDIEPSKRDLTYTNFILRGRLVNTDPMDFRYKDQTIISSTHWLYDRILKITNTFPIYTQNVNVGEANKFVNDVKTILFAPRSEVDEQKKYGTFPQFKINLLRLFLSPEMQSKYSGMMKRIIASVDKIRNDIEGAEKDAKKRKNVF